MPHLVLSDIHLNNWSAFGETLPSGINSRLEIALKEIRRACDVLASKGGNRVIIAGDLFHKRGAIDPEVFNPAYKLFSKLCERGFEFSAIPGNHDLKTRETTELGNAIQTLDEIPGFSVITTPQAVDGFYFIPWMSEPAAVLEALKEMPVSERPHYDAIIHMGINGVLKGLPGHALEANELAELGYARILAGHFHNHKSMCDGAVYSIGATAHQNWGDVGTKAGFLIVDDREVSFHASHAPSFIDISSETHPDDIELMVPGNYVRLTGMDLMEKEARDLRQGLLDLGALGVIYQGTIKAVTARGIAAPSAEPIPLEVSVADYVGGLTLDPHIDRSELLNLCARLLRDSHAVS